MRGLQQIIEIAYIFKNENKRKIIDQIVKEPGTAYEISEKTGVELALTRTQLSLMKKTGIIKAKKDSRHTIYLLNKKLYQEFEKFTNKITES